MDTLAEKALASADRLSHTRSEGAGARAYLDFMRGQWIEKAWKRHFAPQSLPTRTIRTCGKCIRNCSRCGRTHRCCTHTRFAWLRRLIPLAPVVADRLGILQLWLGHDADAASDRALARELGLDEISYPETRVLLELHQHDDADAADGLRRIWREPCTGRMTGSDKAIDAYRHSEKRPAAVQLLDRTLAAGGISTRIYFGLMVLLESPARALRAFARRAATSIIWSCCFSVDAAAVRRDPAFGEFTRKMGLEAYWDRFGWPGACHRGPQKSPAIERSAHPGSNTGADGRCVRGPPQNSKQPRSGCGAIFRLVGGWKCNRAFAAAYSLSQRLSTGSTLMQRLNQPRTLFAGRWILSATCAVFMAALSACGLRARRCRIPCPRRPPLQRQRPPPSATASSCSTSTCGMAMTLTDAAGDFLYKFNLVSLQLKSPTARWSKPCPQRQRLISCN